MRPPLLIAVYFVLAAHLLAAVDFASLDQLARAELARTGIPGCAVAVVVDGQLAYSQGYGVANVDTGEPVRAEMLFRLGSTTKMFTAATVVALARDGRLKLDAPIGNVVSGLAPKIARVTAHQLLSHSAGLGDDAPMDGPHDDSALAAACRALTDRLVFAEPAKIYSYSNPGFWLAGLAAEVAGGKPYADLVAERVLAPCGMVRSTFRPTLAMTWPLAIGHAGEHGKQANVIRPLADNAATWPAGQLFSSAPEFARFCIALMSGGQLDGRTALAPELVAALTTPHVAVADGESHYGYGLAVRTDAGLRWWSHTGSRAGYGSVARLCPDRGFAVIVLCNRSGEHLPRVADKAAALVLGPQPPPRLAAKPFPSPTSTAPASWAPSPTARPPSSSAKRTANSSARKGARGPSSAPTATNAARPAARPPPNSFSPPASTDTAPTSPKAAARSAAPIDSFVLHFDPACGPPCGHQIVHRRDS